MPMLELMVFVHTTALTFACQQGIQKGSLVETTRWWNNATFLCFSNPNSGSGCCSFMQPCRMSSQPLAPTNVASFSASMDQGAMHSSISFKSTIHCVIHVPLCKQRIGLLNTTSNPSLTSLTNTHNTFASEHVLRTSLPTSL